MKITLNTFANIRDVVGSRQLALELQTGARLADLFELLGKTYGKKFDRQVRDQISGALVPFLILVNNQTYRSTADMDALLHEGDAVTIMIPFDGG
jgi:molybdopterin converting factor small subunit